MTVSATPPDEVEGALRRSEERYRMLVDAVPELLWARTSDGQEAFFNQSWFAFTGLSEEELRSSGWLSVVHPRDRPLVESHRSHAHEIAQAYAVEARFRRYDGSYCWHLVRVTPLRNDDGGIGAWFGSAIDIDDRKRSEEARGFLAEAGKVLATSLDYETILASVAHLAVSHLADWCAIDVVEDSSIRRLVVAHVDPAKEHLAQRLRDGYPPDSTTPRGVARALATGEPEMIPEISDAMLATSVKEVELRDLLIALGLRSAMVVPMVAHGQVLGAISFATAESGRHYSQADLNLAEDLASRAALALDNAALYRRTQEAVHERELLLSVASHELKNPLASLLGYARLIHGRLASGKAPTDKDRYGLGLIVDQGERLSRMLDLLLDLSRIEAGRLVIERAPVDLGALIGRVVEELKPTLDVHTMTYDKPADPVIVTGDELRLEQVLRNLIGNAVKYSPAGGPILVRIRRNDGQARVEVRDHGLGIPADAVPHLFQRFYRAKNIGSPTVGGLGVGLYVVKEIITRHGGTIDVRSIEGEGSTFTFCLPLP